jgi:hypothetical protein
MSIQAEPRPITFKSVGLRGWPLILLVVGTILLVSGIITTAAFSFVKMPTYGGYIHTNEIEFMISENALQPIEVQVGATFAVEEGSTMVKIKGKHPLPYNITILDESGKVVLHENSEVEIPFFIDPDRIQDSSITEMEVHEVKLSPGTYRLKVGCERELLYKIVQTSKYLPLVAGSTCFAGLGAGMVVLWFPLALGLYKQAVKRQIATLAATSRAREYRDLYSKDYEARAQVQARSEVQYDQVGAASGLLCHRCGKPMTRLSSDGTAICESCGASSK